jgi:hypothetical protein
VLIGVAGALILRALRGQGVASVRVTADAPPSPPEPLFPTPFAGVTGRAVGRLRDLRLPEQYRTLVRPSLLERAASGPPWFWVVVTAALVFAVTR